MRRQYNYSEDRYKKLYGKKTSRMRIMTLIAIGLEIVFGMLRRNGAWGEDLPMPYPVLIDIVLAVFLIGVLGVLIYHYARRRKAKESIIIYEDGLIRYITLKSRDHEGDNTAVFSNYYIENIRKIEDYDTHLIVYGDIKLSNVAKGDSEEKKIEKVKIPKYFGGLDELIEDLKSRID